MNILIYYYTPAQGPAGAFLPVGLAPRAHRWLLHLHDGASTFHYLQHMVVTPSGGFWCSRTYWGCIRLALRLVPRWWQRGKSLPELYVFVPGGWGGIPCDSTPSAVIGARSTFSKGRVVEQAAACVRDISCCCCWRAMTQQGTVVSEHPVPTQTHMVRRLQACNYTSRARAAALSALRPVFLVWVSVWHYWPLPGLGLAWVAIAVSTTLRGAAAIGAVEAASGYGGLDPIARPRGSGSHITITITILEY